MQIGMPPLNLLRGKAVKRLSVVAILFCVFASAALIDAAFLSENSVAAPGEAAEAQPTQAPSRFRLAQNEAAGAVTDPNAALEALIKEGKEGRAGANDSKGEEAPTPAVDEETLSLYPTAAQCGQ